MNSRCIRNFCKTTQFPPVNSKEENELQPDNIVGKKPEGASFIESVTECMESVRDKFKKSKKEVDRIEMCQVNLAVKWLLEVREQLRRFGIRDDLLLHKLTFFKLSSYIKCLMKINSRLNLFYRTTKIKGKCFNVLSFKNSHR